MSGVFSWPLAMCVCLECILAASILRADLRKYICARVCVSLSSGGYFVFVCVCEQLWVGILYYCVCAPLRLPSQECILYPIQYLFRAPHISGPIDTSDSLQDNNRSSRPPPLYGYHYYHPPRGNAQNREGGRRFHPSSIPLSIHPDPLSFYYFTPTGGVRDGGMEWTTGEIKWQEPY